MRSNGGLKLAEKEVMVKEYYPMFMNGKEVCDLLRICKNSLTKYKLHPTFPKGKRISHKVILYETKQVFDWMDSDPYFYAEGNSIKPNF